MDARTLKGRTAEAFALLGKPCVGARYLGSGDRHELLDGAACVVCGRPATEAHHCPPKGMGGGRFRLSTPKGDFTLRAPLLAVCGCGNATGCHGLFHAGMARASWEWDSPEFERLWLDGTLLEGREPNEVGLFAFGRYVIDSPYGRKEVRG